MKRTVLSVFVLSMIFILSCSQKNNKSETESLSAGSVLKDAPFNIEMVYIPAGTLKLEADYERHAMVVSLESFYIGKYELTQKQWEEVMGNNPSEFIGDDLPVTNVSWYDAEGFVRKLSDKTGHFYRLPTDAEWEYACRAGTVTDYHFGNDTLLIGEYEWHKGNSGGQLHPVGLKKPNPRGLYDMGGNVCEWTIDLWNPAHYYRRNPDREPFNDNLRIVRSSSYLHGRAAHFRSDYQHAYQEKSQREYTGFRVVRDL